MLEDLLVFAAVGFAAQMIDGAIGMAYGLSATSVLLTLGVAPATASASGAKDTQSTASHP